MHYANWGNVLLLVTQFVFYCNRPYIVCSFNSQVKMLVELQSLPAAIWKALCSSLGAHENLQTLSLAGSAIGDATLQVRYPELTKCVRAHQY